MVSISLGATEVSGPGARARRGRRGAEWIPALAKSAPAELRTLAERAFATVVDGVVSLPVTAESGLAEAAEAHRLTGARKSVGKLLLRVGGDAV